MIRIFVLLLAMFTVNERAWAAAQFDLPEFIRQGDYSAGGLAEVLISDPTSEGIEGRLKYGLVDWMNIQGVLGMGSDYRQFRVGMQNTFRVFNEAGYRPTVSFQLSPYYIERGDGPTLTDSEGDEFVDTNGKIQLNAGVTISRYFGLAGWPINTYVSIPLTIELVNGNYKTGSQVIFGGVASMRRNKNYFFTGEMGFGVAQFETYVAFGGGRRFGSTGHVPSFADPRAQSNNRIEVAPAGQAGQPQARPNNDGTFNTVE